MDLGVLVQHLPEALMGLKDIFYFNQRKDQEKATLRKMVKSVFAIGGKLDKDINEEETDQDMLPNFLLTFRCATQDPNWRYWHLGNDEHGLLPTFKKIIRKFLDQSLDNDFLERIDHLESGHGNGHAEDLQELQNGNQWWEMFYTILVLFPFRLQDYVGEYKEAYECQGKLCRKNALTKVEE